MGDKQSTWDMIEETAAMWAAADFEAASSHAAAAAEMALAAIVTARRTGLKDDMIQAESEAMGAMLVARAAATGQAELHGN